MYTFWRPSYVYDFVYVATDENSHQSHAVDLVGAGGGLGQHKRCVGVYRI